MTTAQYEGRENLEAMEQAKNYNAHLLSLVTDALPRPGARVLDFGAGLGSYAAALRRLGCEVSCVETDLELRRRLEELGFRTSEAATSFAPACFDFIYSLNVLEHIEDDVAALRDLRTRLAPEGKLLVFVPAFQVLFSSMDRRVGHRRRYSGPALERALSDAGFTTSAIRYVDSLGFLAALAFRFFGSDTGVISRRQVAAYDRFVFPISSRVDLACRRFFGKNLVAIASVN